MTRCACPQSDARACYRYRHKIDMREHLDGCEIETDEECACSCHDNNPDDDCDDDDDRCPECNEYRGHCECDHDLEQVP